MRVTLSIACACLATPALAGLEVCNATGQSQSVAIGYVLDGVWTSEGWWNIDDGDCADPIQGNLLNRYYYYRAEVTDGRFEDEGYMFCVSDKVFTIAGQDACEARGYDRAGFAAIDTGETATHFKLTLVPPEETPAPDPAKAGQGSAATPQTSQPSYEVLESGYSKGTSGEPFTQMAMFQGCEAVDGNRYCAFFAQGWKWFAYYDNPTPASFLDRVDRLQPGIGVEISGDILTYGDISLEVALSSLTVRPASLEHEAELAALQGDWVSMDDANYTLEFVGGELTERYPGTADAFYFWRFGQTCDMAPPEADFALIKTDPESREQECWLPDVITSERLEFINPGRGNLLRFRRP